MVVLYANMLKVNDVLVSAHVIKCCRQGPMSNCGELIATVTVGY